MDKNLKTIGELNHDLSVDVAVVADSIKHIADLAKAGNTKEMTKYINWIKKANEAAINRSEEIRSIVLRAK